MLFWLPSGLQRHRLKYVASRSFMYCVCNEFLLNEKGLCLFVCFCWPGFPAPFNWPDYLEATGSIAVPDECFSKVCRPTCRYSCCYVVTLLYTDYQLQIVYLLQECVMVTDGLAKLPDCFTADICRYVDLFSLSFLSPFLFIFYICTLCMIALIIIIIGSFAVSV